MISRGWLTHIHNLAQKNVGIVFYSTFFNDFFIFRTFFTSMLCEKVSWLVRDNAFAGNKLCNGGALINFHPVNRFKRSCIR
jgi:hypothetical protein